jgi:hypothetical protein
LAPSPTQVGSRSKFGLLHQNRRQNLVVELVTEHDGYPDATCMDNSDRVETATSALNSPRWGVAGAVVRNTHKLPHISRPQRRSVCRLSRPRCVPCLAPRCVTCLAPRCIACPTATRAAPYGDRFPPHLAGPATLIGDFDPHITPSMYSIATCGCDDRSERSTRVTASLTASVAASVATSDVSLLVL